MRESKIPFHTKEYTLDEKRKKFFPFLDVLVGTKESKKKISALANTGCNPCLYFFKSYVEKEGLNLGKKINKEPIPILVADGHLINADIYKVTCEIAGIEEEIEVFVADPEKYFEQEEPEITTVKPLLGRGILDRYDVLFKGSERKILLFHPDR